MVELGKEINFFRTDYELEEFMLFSIMVAGKKASTTVRILDDILKEMHNNIDSKYELRPFQLIFNWIEDNPNINFDEYLRDKGVGCYTHKAKSILCLIDTAIDLRICSLEDLEQIYGIGRKTSRFFLMCNRPGVRAAILDRHILRYLLNKGYDVPQNTPSSKYEYERVERIFLKEAEKNNIDPMQFDYSIWKEAAGIH